jgi:hypothetical protein
MFILLQSYSSGWKLSILFGQFSNFSYEHMNTNFSNLGFESNFSFYTLDRSNHFDFSWQAHATENYAP